MLFYHCIQFSNDEIYILCISNRYNDTIGNTLTDEIDIRVPNYRIKYKRTRISKGSPVEYFDQEQTTDLPFGKL